MERDWLIVFSICTLMLFGCAVQKPPASPPAPNQTTPQATHTAAQAQGAMVKYLFVYYGLYDAVIQTPAYSDGIWSAVANFTVNNAPSTLKVRFYDANLTPESVYVPVELLSFPDGVSELGGKTSCAEGGKIKIMEFADPYCPWCIAYDPTMNALKAKYGNAADFEYDVLLTHSESLALKYGTENVTLVAKYYACAQNQSKLDEFKACAIAKYKEHEEVPLTKEELDVCANGTKLDMSELGSCVSGGGADAMLAFSKKLAETYLAPSLSTPAVLLNCQYRTSPRFAEGAICYLAPNAKSCPQ